MNEAEKRKGQPVFSGVLAYFPDALLAISEHSKAGNDQHNPGQPLHWDRSKSTNDVDALARHLIDHAKEPADLGHLKAVAWRALALLQKAIEAQPGRAYAQLAVGDDVSTIHGAFGTIKTISEERAYVIGDKNSFRAWFPITDLERVA